MTALEKFRQQVAIARAGGTYVVQTAEEAQALLDEIEPLQTLYDTYSIARQDKV